MVNLSLPNELGKLLQTGDIIRMTRGYSGLYKESCANVYELWPVVPYDAEKLFFYFGFIIALLARVHSYVGVSKTC